MRISFRESVSSRDLYDISQEVRLLKIDWALLPNKEEIEEGEIDLESPKGKRRAKKEMKENDRVRDNVNRILEVLIERKTREVRAAASKEVAERVIQELKRMVSLSEGIKILARNIRKPKITTVSQLCSSEEGHHFYRDLTLEEIMLLGLLDRPERAYDVSSNSTYRKAWRVYFDTNTMQAGVIYYFSDGDNFSGYGEEGVRALRVPFKREILQKFRSISEPQGVSVVDFKAYQDDTKCGDKFNEIESNPNEDKKGAQKLVSSRVSKKKMQNKWIFFGNGIGAMAWYSLLTRLAPYLESIPKVFSDNREFKGYAILFDDHLLIYDEKGKLVEKVKTIHSFNDDYVSIDEQSVSLDEDEMLEYEGDFKDYAREQKEESDLLNPLIQVLGYISESALRADDKRNLTPRDEIIRKIRDELGIDLSDTFKRPQNPGLVKSHVVYFEPPLGFRYPELYKAFHFIFNHLSRNLRKVIGWRLGSYPAESLFSRFETESMMGESSKREFKHYYLCPRFEAFALPDRDEVEWDRRLENPWNWFSDKNFPLQDEIGEKGMPVSVLFVDNATLCAIFKKDDRNKYLASILGSLLARVWYVLINSENSRLGFKFIEALAQYPELYDELLTMQNIYSQTGFPTLKFEDKIWQEARGKNSRYFALLFGRLFSLYILEPDKLKAFPEIIEYFKWLESQNIILSKSAGKTKEDTRKEGDEEKPSTISHMPMVKWDKGTAFESAKSDPFWFVYFGPVEWKDLGLEAYFRKKYSPKQLEGLVIKWIKRIRNNYRDKGPFLVGYSILSIIKLLPKTARKKFILEHQKEVRFLFNELLYREDSSYEMPNKGLLDEEREITDLFSDKELAELIDNFIFPIRDVVIFLVNNPQKRKGILSALKNKTLRNIIDFNIDLIEAGEDKARIKKVVDRYGGKNIPKKERKIPKGKEDTTLPSINRAGESRKTLYELSPVLALAEAVLFNNIIFRAFMRLEDLSSVFMQLGVSVSDQEIYDADGRKRQYFDSPNKPQFFTDEFEAHRLVRIICDIYRKDQVLFYMDDLLNGRLKHRIGGILSDFELATLFESPLGNLKVLVNDDNRYRQIKVMRDSAKGAENLTNLAKARKYYLRDKIRDIRRAYIPLSAELEAKAIMALKDLQLDNGTKDGQAPDILIVINACKILGVSLEDDIERVKNIYRKLAFIFHPDRDEGKKYPDVFKLVGKAFEILEKHHNI